MRRPASSALMPLSEALSRLLDGVVPVAARAVASAAAIGRVAAETVEAASPVPALRVALRDGFAVTASEITGASSYGPVPLPRAPLWVEAGEALPESADTVLPEEAIERSGPMTEAVADAPAGEGAGATGRDFTAGHRLIEAGARVRPLHALALASAGIVRIGIREPRIGLVLAGAERRGPDAREAALRALVEAAGAIVTSVVPVPSEVEAIAGALAAEADALLVVGGTGFGRRDRSAAALARAGALDVHGIALRPGETAGFGRVGAVPVLLLPGAPEAMLASFLTLGRPLLAALSGARPEPGRAAPLARKVASTIGLSEVVFVAPEGDAALPLGGAELALNRLMLARGAILVPPEREGYPEGTHVEIMKL
ncbi:molybdopterin-binding protein [Methylobacterium nigriterrae]|uniref:molybdopterin-binding protein n=1 Tax=Methylobacterium nigriterrae TaxID=3127512 RepID=UPI003013659B